ncbi:hypothetical protein ACFQJ5_09245 [Halomicroarcula sp. GCM10025324]|nr:hypothetical protein [Halomicroarcula sp. ZS-22-S1]
MRHRSAPRSKQAPSGRRLVVVTIQDRVRAAGDGEDGERLLAAS